jgi:hypothetical protein
MTHKLPQDSRQVHITRKVPFAYVEQFIKEIQIIDHYPRPIVPISADHPFKPVSLKFQFASRPESIRFCGTWIADVELSLN